MFRVHILNQNLLVTGGIAVGKTFFLNESLMDLLTKCENTLLLTPNINEFKTPITTFNGRTISSTKINNDIDGSLFQIVEINPFTQSLDEVKHSFMEFVSSFETIIQSGIKTVMIDEGMQLLNEVPFPSFIKFVERLNEKGIRVIFTSQLELHRLPVNQFMQIDKLFPCVLKLNHQYKPLATAS
ncbi:TPA: hypothetical protein ACGW65_001145 [Bacillus paranthracis]